MKGHTQCTCGGGVRLLLLLRRGGEREELGGTFSFWLGGCVSALVDPRQRPCFHGWKSRVVVVRVPLPRGGSRCRELWGFVGCGWSALQCANEEMTFTKEQPVDWIEEGPNHHYAPPVPHPSHPPQAPVSSSSHVLARGGPWPAFPPRAAQLCQGHPCGLFP